MRQKENFNYGWLFLREDDGEKVLSCGEKVTLPHTWNAVDGQDGGNDYYRGTCWYAKRFSRPALKDGQEAWLEFEGVAMTAQVFLNGKLLARHEGGFSTFRVNLTGLLEEENLLTVSADNGRNRTVYPQKADFTFYGGIYRDVNLLIVPAAHFALDDWGSSGIKITPVVSEDFRRAEVTVEAGVTGEADSVRFCIGELEQIAPVQAGKATAMFALENVHLWNATEDPYLYTLHAALPSGDALDIPFGCRRFSFDAQQGFILNGKRLRLCGAARHQDRLGMGNALTRAEHEEDVALLREMGANTVRLAHYQHCQYFYDLCDKAGLVTWAEIPYITEHMPEGRANTLSQMTELIRQSYNHPSIICWGLSNEITAAGGVTEDMVDNHRELQTLCHQLDPTRPTTMAHAFMLDMNDPFVGFSDICGYNLYFGWYLCDMTYNDGWFDEFHAAHPSAFIALSEYGADANPDYQNGNPQRGDWTEGYQALYHEHLLKMWSERPYIWAMHCWNMFDFGADGRNEAGRPGQNQKGLVTFDRKMKKDAFFIYKAYLSDEPFVHLCGSRYVDRPEAETEIIVYSNQKTVELLVDGKTFAVQDGDKAFRFRVPITGQHTIEARSGKLTDTIAIRKVDKPNPAYAQAGGEVVNWFDRPDEVMREGYYSIMDSVADIKTTEEGRALVADLMARSKKSNGEVAEHITMPENLQREIDKMSLEQMLKQMGKAVKPDVAKKLNAALNQIPKQ